jgi:hypothetical protein
MRHHSWLVAALAAGLACAPAALAQERCSRISFPRSESSTIVTGVAPADGVVCYEFATQAGQTASLKVLSGRNVIFSIIDVMDAQNDYTFRTQQKTYKFVVGQLMRSITNEPFRIRVSVTGQTRSGDDIPREGQWTANAPDARRSAPIPVPLQRIRQ